MVFFKCQTLYGFFIRLVRRAYGILHSIAKNNGKLVVLLMGPERVLNVAFRV